uniref:Oxidoreductase NAD-binding domain-containing protein 1 n=1 Tax=Scylla olivacea TaxID=85551 RepID=A0A0P4W8E4_SCYOL
MSTLTPEEPVPAAPISRVAGQGKHLVITAEQTRQSLVTAATVTRVWQASPSVRCLTLAVHDPRVSFKGGQWVDLFIPGLEIVGGFSMCSPPHQLAQEGTLDLGVKYSKWPPALWVHEECKVGSEVHIRVGGDFHYPPSPLPQKGGDRGVSLPPYPLLLVGGGVGVNPLASMLFQIHSLHRLGVPAGGEVEGALPEGTKGAMLYSARTYEEILYKEELNKVAEEMSNFRVSYFTTREAPPNPSLAIHGRITASTLSQAVSSLSASHPPLCYLCGPPCMSEDVSRHLQDAGVPRERILYEKWW